MTAATLIFFFFFLAVYHVEAQQVTATWDDNCNAPLCIEDGFRMERCEGMNCANFQPLANIGRDVLIYIDSNVELGKSYGYRLKAFRETIESTYSNSAYITMPGLMLTTRPGLLMSISRRATNTSSVVSILVNRNETLGPQGVEIAYRSGVALSISRRATDTSSVVSLLINKDEILSVNGGIK